MIQAVVLAGGSGTRLWPLSRAKNPKQFLQLHGNYTMLQSTFNRLSDLEIKSSVTICNEEHRFFVAEQLREIDKIGSIILEPSSRNTAPAIALAALTAQDDPLLLVLAADHVIEDKKAFASAITKAVPLAEQGKLISFGVIPKEPHVGYGYIKRGVQKVDGFVVDKFVEKPSSKLAQEYFASGEYYWNSGMFLFRASRYLEELKKFRSDIYDICKSSVSNVEPDLDFLRINEAQFDLCPNESIDYAVMEKTEDAIVVPMDSGWSDIGSWSSLWDVKEKDSYGNVISGDVKLHNTRNSYIRSEGRLVATIGVEDLVLIDTEDALFVSKKSDVDNVKYIVEKLKKDSRPEWEVSREVYRPWGKYHLIYKDEGYQVKKLTVNPGAKLSVQMHLHRSEHWVVVAGKARVHYEDKSFDLNINESTYHSKKVIHSLENLGDMVLELIEVQVGNYLEEDDIVRISDNYGRT